MLGVWRDSYIPHLNGRREAMQGQNATFFSSGLVAEYKPPYPHEEEKAKLFVFWGGLGLVGGAAAVYSRIILASTVFAPFW